MSRVINLWKNSWPAVILTWLVFHLSVHWCENRYCTSSIWVTVVLSELSCQQEQDAPRNLSRLSWRILWLIAMPSVLSKIWLLNNSNLLQSTSRLGMWWQYFTAFHWRGNICGWDGSCHVMLAAHLCSLDTKTLGQAPASLWAGMMPSEQMGMSVSSLKTMHVHQVWLIRAGWTTGKSGAFWGDSERRQSYWGSIVQPLIFEKKIKINCKTRIEVCMNS